MNRSGISRRTGAGLLVLALVFLSLTGCGRLQSGREVKAGLRLALPEAEILDVETGTRSDRRYHFRRYTIDHQGVIFTYENYQSADFFFGVTTASSEHDYCKQLFARFSQEIEAIEEQYGVEAEAWGGSISLSNEIVRMEDIEAGAQALDALYRLLEDYLPRTALPWLPVELKLWTQYGVPRCILIQEQGDWDYGYNRQLLYLNFKDDIEQGLAEDVVLSQELLEAIPRKYIRALYIDGAPCESERYEIRFLYSLEDGTYYAPVGFGVEMAYNGGVEDYLQREIIERYYPEAGYAISMEDQTTSYRIGGDSYLVKRREDGLTFYKNGRALPIPSYQERSGTSTGAVYYHWIPVEDFAAILGMTVEKVEEDGIYLRSS